MSTGELLATLLASATVSGIVSFILKYFFESRQQHQYEQEFERLKRQHEIELEQLKAELTVNATIRQELIVKQLDIYVKIGELVYRTCNLVRDATQNPSQTSMRDEIEARRHEIEEILYRTRIELRHGELFTKIHTYKNLLRKFEVLLDEVFPYDAQTGQVIDVESNKTEIVEVQQEVEDTYSLLIEMLHFVSQ